MQVEQLKSLGPSALDVEIRMLDTDHDLAPFLQLFLSEFPKGANYELLQVCGCG